MERPVPTAFEMVKLWNWFTVSAHAVSRHPNGAQASCPCIGDHLLARLREAGVGHVFGVPGDYMPRFYDRLCYSDIEHADTTREDTAAFAADGYACCRGLGALAVTYGVGARNVVNGVAGANAESSPVVVIGGAPGVKE